MDHLVFDTSAILNFGQRDHLEELLPKLATIYQIVTTDAVVQELVGPDQREFTARLLRTHFHQHKLKTEPFDLAVMSHLSGMLGSGEISVITVTRELTGIAVLDDRTARIEAAKLGLKIVGTLGLLHEAMQRRWLTDDQCLDKVRALHANNFRIRNPHANETFAEYFAALQSQS